MIKLLILLFFVCLWAILSQKRSAEILTHTGSERLSKRLDLFCFFLIFALSMFAGLRTEYNDTAAYINGFRNAVSPAEFLADPENLDLLHNPAFFLFQSWMRTITGNAQIFVMVTSIFVEFSMIRFLKQYSRSFSFSVYLFMTYGTFVFTLAAMKQVMAMAILTYAFPYLENKKWLRYYLLVFIAMLFHTYAITFAILPLFRLKPWSWFTYLFATVLILVLLNFQDTISNFLDFADEQGKTIAEYEVFDDHSVNIFRVLVYAVTPAISFVFQKDLFKHSGPRECILTHMSIISLAFMVLGTVEGANMFGRMATYFEMGTLVALPGMLKKCFHGRRYQVVTTAATVCFFAYFLYANRYIGSAYHMVSLFPLF